MYDKLRRISKNVAKDLIAITSNMLKENFMSPTVLNKLQTVFKRIGSLVLSEKLPNE
jgi:hypothetical protein